MTSSKLVNVNVSVRSEETNHIQRMRECRQEALAKSSKRK